MTLDEIAIKHGTDQASFGHAYCEQIYEPLFSRLRNEPIKLLEIGTQFGGSIRTWCEYFPNGQIVGMDVYDEVGVKPANYTHILGDQSKEKDLFRVSAMGPYDFILDDGAHISNHIIVSFEYLFRNALKPGGVYCATDLHATYLPQFNVGSSIRAIDYFRNLVHKVTWMGVGQCGDPRKSEGHTLDYLEQSIESITFYKSVVVIVKR